MSLRPPPDSLHRERPLSGSRQKVEPFDGDTEDYQQWLSDVQKREKRADDAPKENNANSAQSRKMKRREAERYTRRRCVKRLPVWKEMEKLNAQLAQAEEEARRQQPV